MANILSKEAPKAKETVAVVKEEHVVVFLVSDQHLVADACDWTYHQNSRSRKSCKRLVYLAHGSCDKPLARETRDRIAKRCRIAEAAVFLDEQNLTCAALRKKEDLNDFIDNSEVVVIFATVLFFSSDWSTQELDRAMEKKRRVLPVFIGPYLTLEYVKKKETTPEKLVEYFNNFDFAAADDVGKHWKNTRDEEKLVRMTKFKELSVIGSARELSDRNGPYPATSVADRIVNYLRSLGVISPVQHAEEKSDPSIPDVLDLQGIDQHTRILQCTNAYPAATVLQNLRRHPLDYQCHQCLCVRIPKELKLFRRGLNYLCRRVGLEYVYCDYAFTQARSQLLFVRAPTDPASDASLCAKELKEYIERLKHLRADLDTVWAEGELRRLCR